MTYKKALAEAKKTSSELRVNEYFKRQVFMHHSDGTVCLFHYATVIWLDKQWVCIFTEHHGYHVYDKEDLVSLSDGNLLDYPVGKK